jgi:hypothetical protein
MDCRDCNRPYEIVPLIGKDAAAYGFCLGTTTCLIKPLEPRIQLASDIIIGAIEGGTGYWAQVLSYSHGCGEVGGSFRSVRPARARIQDLEDGIDYLLTCEKVLEAAAKLAREKLARSDIVEITAGALLTNDAGDIDSEVADVIVQVACFGEVVYG